MVLFIINLGLNETVEERKDTILDSIYRHCFGNDMEMYKMYDRTC